jgi:hypothetical protein
LEIHTEQLRILSGWIWRINPKASGIWKIRTDIQTETSSIKMGPAARNFPPKNCPLLRESGSNGVEMPNTPTDEDLLNAFAKSHDEQAFRRLAERYSGLIFHTALRTLNDRTLAEDVAQRVLGVLAKKGAQVARGNAPLPA